jgi:hypothetical protein
VYANHAGAELGYAVTDHVAQGRTVHTGLAVITGTGDNGPTQRLARVLLPSWPATTRFIPNETAFVPRSPGLPRRA